MIDELEVYTDTLRIQELDLDAAQALYDKAMELALSLAEVKSLMPADAAENLREAQQYAVAAEEFAYAYYKQNDETLDGAADPVEDYEIENTPSWVPKPDLAEAELRSKVLIYLKRRHPQTFGTESWLGD